MKALTAQELRCKNLLSTIADEPEVITIDQIDSFEETVCGNAIENIPISDLQPIPITGDWLKKFGFESNHFGWSAHWWLEPIQIVKYNDGFCVCTSVDAERDHSWRILRLVEYVHQLQNLFFCLCGEELTIKK